MNLVNIKTNQIRRCAFCKHWYDPTNAALKMRDPAAGFWEYDPQMRSRCSLKSIETIGMQACGKFEGKL